MSVASPQTFGAGVRRARKRLGLTGTQVCAAAGIPGHNILTRIEQAQNEPGLFKAARIAAALGESLDTLLAAPDCERCDDRPPPGVICPGCRKRGGTP